MKSENNTHNPNTYVQNLICWIDNGWSVFRLLRTSLNIILCWIFTRCLSFSSVIFDHSSLIIQSIWQDQFKWWRKLVKVPQWNLRWEYMRDRDGFIQMLSHCRCRDHTTRVKYFAAVDPAWLRLIRRESWLRNIHAHAFEWMSSSLRPSADGMSLALLFASSLCMKRSEICRSRNRYSEGRKILVASHNRLIRII